MIRDCFLEPEGKKSKEGCFSSNQNNPSNFLPSETSKNPSVCSEIHRTGIDSSAKKVYYLTEATRNQRFSDNEGNYLGRIGDHIAYRYEILELVGRGAFAQVFECKDHKTNQKVAIKVYNNRKFYTKSGISENQLIENLAGTENLIRKIKSFEYKGHFMLVLELLAMNLYEFQQKHQFKGISQVLLKQFSKQVLTALSAIHSLGYIHCDVKPSNLMISSESPFLIKLIDFNSAVCTASLLPSSVQNIYYKAPEVVLCSEYDSKIDIWSLGCVLYELHKGRPLFPVTCEQELIQSIQSTLGKPSACFLSKCELKDLFFSQNSVQKNENLDKILDCDKEFYDFIKRCLEWDPDERFSAEDALLHPWLKFS